MTLETVFDLASLTKPLATTLAVMQAVGEGRLGLQDPLGSILPGFERTERAAVTIRHLLCHNSGLPDYLPFYLKLIKLLPPNREAALRRELLATRLVRPVGAATLYSDLGFMILRWAVETVLNRRLDKIVAESFYQPLGVPDLRFLDRYLPLPDRVYAATEMCPWRGVLLEGEVHDENAWVLGGVEGHAGLFGTAADVNRLLGKLLSTYCGEASTGPLDRGLLLRFFARQDDADRALGFDIPSPSGSACGRLFSARTIGHLGFTGTSFWVDLDRAIVVILLTNRIHPTRDNTRIRAFRPVFHDTVMETVIA